MAQLTVRPVLTLEEAVGGEGEWGCSSGGGAGWTVIGSGGLNGGSAGQSGSLSGPGETSWLESTVPGPGNLSSWWKVSCQSNYVSTGGTDTNTSTGYWTRDYATFTVNGSEWAQREGEGDWEQRNWNLPSGSHTLRWTYVKNSDNTTTSGQGRMWVDEVAFISKGLRLLQPNSSNSTFRVSVPTENGRSYVLEYKSSLAEEVWTSLSSMTGDGSTRVLMDSSGPVAQRFHRVRQE